MCGFQKGCGNDNPVVESVARYFCVRGLQWLDDYATDSRMQFAPKRR